MNTLRPAPLMLAAALAGCPPATLLAEDDAPSVLVATMKPVRGSLPDIVDAFGTAVPALNGSMTVSLQSQGLVERFLVTSGEAVKAGQPLIEFAVSQAALGSFRQAETALATAKIDRARVEQLRAQRLATKDQVTQAEKAIADAQNTLDTLKKSGGDKAHLVLKARFDGVVSNIPVAPGDTVAPGASMMTLIRTDGLVVTVGVEPSRRLRMRVGNAATLTPLTSGGSPAQGHVVRIDGLLNPKTRLVDVDVATEARLLAGAPFRAAIRVGSFAGFVVPRDAVLHDDNGAYCFQVSGGTAKRVGVEIVASTDGGSAIEGPIDPTLPLVVSGNYQLVDRMRVRFAPAPGKISSGGP